MRSFRIFVLFFVLVFSFSQFSAAMTRTLKKEPVIVIAAFGTTTKAKVTYDFFDAQLKRKLPPEYQNLKIAWAFTSEIVRERANKKFKEKGIKNRYRSLLQVLADLEDEGYRKIAVQSLHIFPGQEYNEMVKIIDAFRHLGLRIEYGGTLLHDWPEAYETIEILEKAFLSPQKGCNVLVAHGTPLTFPGSNSTYLGLDRYITMKYENVFVGAVDGVLTREQVLGKAKKCKTKNVRFIPFMYVAGDHIMNDIMGTEPDDESVPSWSMEMKKAGFTINSVSADYHGKKYHKGLGFYREVNDKFIHMLIESLQRLKQ